MCRLILKTAVKPFSPFRVIKAMEAMREGYDGSGMGLLMRGIEFYDFIPGPKDVIVSGICHTEASWRRFEKYMERKGFLIRYTYRFNPNRKKMAEKNRYRYLLRAYSVPDNWEGYSRRKLEDEFMNTRLELRKDGEAHGNDLTIFSFWPDAAIIKEIGWPMEIAQMLNLDEGRINAKVVMVQGRQNTNWGINLYACHPFFIQGIATMTNGENTAFIPIKEWLTGANYPGYIGYQSDSEVLTHILHYVVKRLKLPLQAYKHVITPLKGEELSRHPQGDFLEGLKNVCRRLIIDGPNCVMASFPDETCLMLMDHKKLRPAVIGGRPGEWCMSSEMCGLDALIPDRDRSLDFQPMRENTVVVPPDRKEYKVWSQFDRLPLSQVA